MRSKRTPPIGPVKSLKLPGFGGTLSGGAFSVIVLAVTLYSLFVESGATPASRLTSEIGTSIVIVPNDPSTKEQAPSAVICFVPGYVSVTPPPTRSAAFWPDQQLVDVPFNSK